MQLAELWNVINIKIYFGYIILIVRGWHEIINVVDLIRVIFLY